MIPDSPTSLMSIEASLAILRRQSGPTETDFGRHAPERRERSHFGATEIGHGAYNSFLKRLTPLGHWP
jgi:hypothetical protein